MLSRDAVFDRVIVDYLARGTARISWSYHRNFVDPPPYVTQLQVGTTGDPAATDWQPVGLAATDAIYATDDQPRLFGAGTDVYYRIQLTTPAGQYASEPVPADGVLSRRDWLIAREVVRQQQLLRRHFDGVNGWLFKQRRTGAAPAVANPATAVTDPISGGILSHNNPLTLGTSYLGGYFAPVAFNVLLQPGGKDEHIDPERGTVDTGELSRPGMILLIPHVQSRDVFVAAGSDRRYFIHEIQEVADYRGVPLLANCRLTKAEATDAIYTLPVPGS